MPLSGPVLATAAILKFLAMYNQYLWPLMVTQEEGYRPVMVGLQYFFQLNRRLGRDHGLPVSLITVPVLAFYLFLQTSLHRVDRLDRREGLTETDHDLRTRRQMDLGQLVRPDGDTLARLSSCRPTSRSATPTCAISTSTQGHATVRRSDRTGPHLGTTFAPARTAPAWDD